MNKKIRNTLVALGIVALPLLGLTGCNRWGLPGNCRKLRHPMNAKLTDEQILAVPELVTRYTATHRPPDDSTITVSVRNYDGQDRHPTLRGLDVRVSVTTADADYVAELVARLFGSDAEPDSQDDYDSGRVTRWRDTLDVSLDWTRPHAAVAIEQS